MYFEALIIAIAGIILGTAVGIIAILCLVQIVNALTTELFIADDMNGIRVVIPFWIFVIVYALTFVVVFLSCRSSARRAAKISPIEALRGVYDTKVKNKKLKRESKSTGVLLKSPRMIYKLSRQTNKTFRILRRFRILIN